MTIAEFSLLSYAFPLTSFLPREGSRETMWIGVEKITLFLYSFNFSKIFITIKLAQIKFDFWFLSIEYVFARFRGVWACRSHIAFLLKRTKKVFKQICLFLSFTNTFNCFQVGVTSFCAVTYVMSQWFHDNAMTSQWHYI